MLSPSLTFHPLITLWMEYSTVRLETVSTPSGRSIQNIPASASLQSLRIATAPAIHLQ